jgi:hypothetical protein
MFIVATSRLWLVLSGSQTRLRDSEDQPRIHELPLQARKQPMQVLSALRNQAW